MGPCLMNGSWLITPIPPMTNAAMSRINGHDRSKDICCISPPLHRGFYRPFVFGVTEREDATVLGDQPVAGAAGGRSHTHHRGVQCCPAHAAVEAGVSVREDPAIGGDKP